MTKTDTTEPWSRDQYTEIHRAYVELENSDALIVGIINAMTAVTESDFKDLPPLRDAVNPESLNSLISHSTDASSQVDTFVRFTYAGYVVIASTDGRISIYEPA